MRSRTTWFGTLAIILAVLVAAAVFAGEGEEKGTDASADKEKAEAQHEFVGATKCKTCHNSTKKGKIYDKWLETDHAKAFETLASEASLKLAKEKGIEDPQKADECLKCHVTGHGVKAELLGKKYAVEEGVTCESCHGAGGDYLKMSTMKALTAGEADAGELGFLTPDENTCLGCHNEESPTYKEFDFEAKYAEIEHSVPEAE
jgi:hypothetical protein